MNVTRRIALPCVLALTSVAALASVAATPASPPAAWGANGHRVVATIAERRLLPVTRFRRNCPRIRFSSQPTVRLGRTCAGAC